MAKEIFFKFGMWGSLPGGHLCSKTSSNQMKDHGATKVWKSCILSSCQYTHGVVRRLLGPYDTLPCVLIYMCVIIFYETDPNRTSGKIKLTPQVDSYTIALLVLTLSAT